MTPNELRELAGAYQEIKISLSTEETIHALYEAADEIERYEILTKTYAESILIAKEQNQKLRETLRPFAKVASYYENDIRDPNQELMIALLHNSKDRGLKVDFTIGDLRKAAEVLKDN